MHARILNYYYYYHENQKLYMLQSVFQLLGNSLRDDTGIYSTWMWSPQYRWSFRLYHNIYNYQT